MVIEEETGDENVVVSLVTIVIRRAKLRPMAAKKIFQTAKKEADNILHAG